MCIWVNVERLSTGNLGTYASLVPCRTSSAVDKGIHRLLLLVGGDMICHVLILPHVKV